MGKWPGGFVEGRRGKRPAFEMKINKTIKTKKKRKKEGKKRIKKERTTIFYNTNLKNNIQLLRRIIGC